MKYYGMIGFETTEETAPGVYREIITERPYYGDLTRNTRRLENVSDQLNNSINISNEISIISDPYAMQNFYTIRYVEFRDVKWKVTNVEVQFPRLILSLGGIYNGQEN